ncbi:tyrosine-type recombinase/integrase [[Clostridium] fimetarium]|uniref:Site-specific recombinase XerD n=1 Tax=[Clostridium] fimetarium TaxID=99656 RepID=A0A1I0M048_9FIRM|nr:site-specific integrase [[Clostridium] fimetarium]SEV81765.1 Site-specific recombinase XerD [[Clostridium] fimetarium]
MAADKKASRKDNKGTVLPANVNQLSDLRYTWRKVIDGNSYTIVDKSLVELKKKIIQKKADVQNHTCRDLDKSTLNQWFYKWIDLYKGNIKPATKANYNSYWEWYVKDSKIGNMQMGKIRRTHIVELYMSLADVKSLAYGTIKYVNSLIYSCLQDAVGDKIIPDNPSDGAISKIERTEPVKREALTKEQQALFIDFISNSDIYKIYLPLFSFMLGTGCRLGEATGITWSDINLKESTISINHTLSYKAVNKEHKFFIGTPKTKASTRTIPIIDDLRKQLLKQKEYQLAFGITKEYKVDGRKGFVFTTHTSKPYTQESINRVIRYIIEASNKQEKIKADKENRDPIILPRFSAHTLRHTFCTRFCENENNVKVIQQIMGHSRIDTTLNIYTHVTKDKAEEVMNNLNGKIKIS